MAADEGGETGVPTSLAIAWGLRDRPQRGPRPGLSVTRIVSAAVAVAGAEGLAAVSMSRVATELGTGPMSLYRYVASKGELLALMVDAAMGPAPGGPVPGNDWRAGMSRWAWTIRDRYKQHPWVLQIPISGLPSLPNEVAWFEEGLRCFEGTRLEESAKSSAMMLVSGYVRNSVTIDADIEAAVAASGKAPGEWMASYARILSQLADPQRFPAIAKFAAAGVFEQFDPPEAEFTFGLDRILDGLATLVATCSAAPPGP